MAVNYIVYADDGSIFRSGHFTADVVNRANRTLALIEHWSSDNNLKLNASKTKVVVFHPRSKVVSIQPLTLGYIPV